MLVLAACSDSWPAKPTRPCSSAYCEQQPSSQCLDSVSLEQSRDSSERLGLLPQPELGPNSEEYEDSSIDFSPAVLLGLLFLALPVSPTIKPSHAPHHTDKTQSLMAYKTLPASPASSPAPSLFSLHPSHSHLLFILQYLGPDSGPLHMLCPLPGSLSSFFI